MDDIRKSNEQLHFISGYSLMMFAMNWLYSRILVLLSTICLASCSLSKIDLSSMEFFDIDKNVCPNGQWKCPGETRCLKASRVCDGKIDCQDGGDENDNLCTYNFCSQTLNRWKCPGNSKVSDIFHSHFKSKIPARFVNSNFN